MRLSAHHNKPVNTVIGGWSISSASAFQGGNSLVYGISGGTFFNNSKRANAVGDPLDGIGGPSVDRLNRYFNTAAFAVPPNLAQGNLGPRMGSVRTPGANNVNLVLAKTFYPTGKVKLDFRASQYNFLNYPVFGSVNTTVGAVGFGTLSIQANNARQTEFNSRGSGAKSRVSAAIADARQRQQSVPSGRAGLDRG